MGVVGPAEVLRGEPGQPAFAQQGVSEFMGGPGRHDGHQPRNGPLGLLKLTELGLKVFSRFHHPCKAALMKIKGQVGQGLEPAQLGAPGLGTSNTGWNVHEPAQQAREHQVGDKQCGKGEDCRREAEVKPPFRPPDRDSTPMRLEAQHQGHAHRGQNGVDEQSRHGTRRSSASTASSRASVSASEADCGSKNRTIRSRATERSPAAI